MSHLKAHDYIDLVRRSGLVEDSQLNRMLAAFQDLTATESGIVCSTLIETGLLTEWQSSRIMEGKYKGFFLAKYKLLGHLGTGGMGSVYLAEHTLLQRRVAIKVLQKQWVKTSSFLERFYLEARAVAALDHSNVVRCHDVGEENGTHYLVMEYVEGESLQSIVASSGPMDFRTAADCVRQAALGLHHAHQAGIVHRDVKPGNLLVDAKGAVKILDLGLARVQDDSRGSLTVAHDETMIGTVDYLAPEQAIDCHEVDARADIYSLGCTLYFLLTGEPPFGSGTMAQRMMKHQTAEPRELRQFQPDVPEDLVAICKRMMAKEPRARYQTAAEVSESLARFAAGQSAPDELHSVLEFGEIAAWSSKDASNDDELGFAPDSIAEPKTAAFTGRQSGASRPEENLAAERDAGSGPARQAGVASKGLEDLLDEMLEDNSAKSATVDLAALLASSNPESGASPWLGSTMNTGPSTSPAPKSEPTIPLWLLIGAGILIGAIVLIVAYSALVSFERERPPEAIEYKNQE